MRRKSPVRLCIAVMLAGLFGFVLAACGRSSPATPIPTIAPTATVAPTASQPTVMPTVLPTVSAGTSAPASVVASPDEPLGTNCGTVQMRGPQTLNGPSAQQAEECLWQAFQQCRTTGSTALTVTQMGVDTFATRTFTLTSGGNGCIIREAVEFRVVPRPPTTATYPCAGLTREASGALHFLACGADGDLIVPSPSVP
jgi:hypothetical protein